MSVGSDRTPPIRPVVFKPRHPQPAGWEKAVESMLKTEHIEFPSNAKAHITLPSCPDYDIEEDEVIDVWIPAEALAESDKPIYAGFFTIKAESYQERIDHAIQGLKEEKSGLGPDAAVATFLLTFFTCEIVAKSVICDFLYEGTDRKSLPKKYNAEDLSNALEFRKINFEKESVEKLFSLGKTLASKMSARQLRNKIVHRMKPQYRSAVRERYESLMGTMTEFLSAVEGWRIRSRGGETES